MKRRDFIKAMLAVPAALALPFRKKHEVYGCSGTDQLTEEKLIQYLEDFNKYIKPGPFAVNNTVEIIENGFIDEIKERMGSFYECHKIPSLITVNKMGFDILLDKAIFYYKPIKKPRVLMFGFTEVFLDEDMENERPMFKIV